ncbi:PREDICTED: endogenous retrovirus group K member 9 Gag polyprotein-like [Calidris pugnax]|uniref:endogenous retrovirus group K member 9 Gag polyprotein-like n=1 Tax=Calidris pugnax TaxID=198806 RepID=UPI00071D4750|nr:PREDICTED: endogenous retrovirus group K member 9 Gag polyprotein-like [Calidris pugnax]XP_014821243.1 PREDICTED: endogenous retrovirus group K member 9 Gag polyprotein-like [Calidris pugnax]
MGQSATKAQQIHKALLMKIVKEQGLMLQPVKLIQLLVWIRDNCPWYPPNGSYDLSDWQKVGERLQARLIVDQDVNPDNIVAWGIIYTALRTFLPTHEVFANSDFPPPPADLLEDTAPAGSAPDAEPVCDSAQQLPFTATGGAADDLDSEIPEDLFDPGPIDSDQEPDLYPPLTPVKAMVASAPTADQILQRTKRLTAGRASLTRPPPYAPSLDVPPNNSHDKARREFVEECRKRALQDGDMEMFQALPAIYRPQQPPRYEMLTYEVIKELRKSVKENGLQSSFTISLLEAISASCTMIPADWKIVLKLVLTAGQYSIWLTEYRELVAAQALDNLAAGHAIGADHLMGEGRYASPAAQVQMDRSVFQQVSALALRALKRVPEGERTERSLGSTHQGAQEPHTDSTDPLQTALSRQQLPQAAELLLMQLAVENANTQRRGALDPVRGKATALNDLIKVCQHVGMEEHRFEVLATALARKLTVARAAVQCFSCGQHGHMKRDCPKQRGRRDRIPNELCPRCQKGYHWSNQCHSKYDKNGDPLPTPRSGSAKRGARSGAPRHPNRAQGQMLQLAPQQGNGQAVQGSPPPCHPRECRAGRGNCRHNKRK